MFPCCAAYSSMIFLASTAMTVQPKKKPPLAATNRSNQSQHIMPSPPHPGRRGSRGHGKPPTLPDMAGERPSRVSTIQHSGPVCLVAPFFVPACAALDSSRLLLRHDDV